MEYTKKYMIEDYERLRRHSNLLDRYLYDTTHGQSPDAVESIDAMRIELWRAKAADGGYVVILDVNTNIWLLDDAIAMYKDMVSPYTLNYRICLERLRIARDKLLGQG